jgi:hypothetical protein
MTTRFGTMPTMAERVLELERLLTGALARIGVLEDQRQVTHAYFLSPGRVSPDVGRFGTAPGRRRQKGNRFPFCERLAIFAVTFCRQSGFQDFGIQRP